MQNKILIGFVIALLSVSGVAYAASTVSYQPSLLPLLTDTFDLGSSTPAKEWNGIYTKNITISGTCTGCGAASLTGGTTGMMAAWASASTLTATSSPTGARFIATSTLPSLFPNATSTGITSTYICLTGDTCRTTWPSGSGGGAWPFTADTYGGVANQSTTTPFWLKNTMVLASTTYFTMASTTGLTNTGSTWLTGLTTKSLLALDQNGQVIASSTIGNAQLSNSTISGISLGGTLGAHTTNATLSGTSYNGSAAVSDWGLNLGNSNIWSAAQNHSYTATSTNSGGIETTNLGTQFIWATSTTATSTIVNALRLGNTAAARDNMLQVDCSGRTWPASISVGGCTSIDGGTTNQGTLLFVHENTNAAGTGRMVNFIQDNFTVTQDMGLSSSSCQNCTAWNFKGFPTGKGIIKIEHTGGGTGFANSSALSIDLLNCTDCQGIFIDRTLVAGTGNLLNLKDNGNVRLTLSASGLLTTTNATTTNLTASTSFGMPSSSNPSPLSAGYLTMSTNSPYQLHVGNGAGGTVIYDARPMFTLTVASTTVLSGTTTSPVFVFPKGVTVTGWMCTVQPSGATAEVAWQYANPTAYTTVAPTYLAASTTPGNVAISTNNTPAIQATSTLSVGAPAGSAVSASCSFYGNNAAI